MILLFEGWDKAGKTTLSKKIQNELNFQYFKSTKEINSNVDLEEAIKYDWRFMLDFLSQITCDVCFDRSFISQYVYSYLLREENIQKKYTSFNVYENIFKNYVKQFNNIQSKIIYCVREDYANIVDDQVDITLADNANELYRQFFFNFNIQPIICHYEAGIDFNFNKIVKELL